MKSALIKLTSSKDVPEDLCEKIFLSDANSTGRFYYCKSPTPLTVKYVYSGCEKYSINGQKTIRVKDGNFLVINSGQKVECVREEGTVQSMSVFFSDNLISEVVSKYQYDLFLDRNISPMDNLQFIQQIWNHHENAFGQSLCSIFNRISEPAKVDSPELDECLLTMADQLVQHALAENSMIKRANGIRKGTREELYKRVHKAKEFMLENKTSVLTLDQIADAGNLSKYHFLRSFKTIYGTSPYKFLQHTRLHESMAMLKTGKFPVSKVAAVLKFHDLSYFSNEFKAFFGLRPSEVIKEKQSY